MNFKFWHTCPTRVTVCQYNSTEISCTISGMVGYTPGAIPGSKKSYATKKENWIIDIHRNPISKNYHARGALQLHRVWAHFCFVLLIIVIVPTFHRWPLIILTGEIWAFQTKGFDHDRNFNFTWEHFQCCIIETYRGQCSFTTCTFQ